MASIFLRKDVHNTESYRMIFKRKGFKYFSLTFDDREAACKFAQEHEAKYFEDPNHYDNWRADLFAMMQRKNLETYDHIRRPVMTISHLKKSSRRS